VSGFGKIDLVTDTMISPTDSNKESRQSSIR
jgi:hypothetical protein